MRWSLVLSLITALLLPAFALTHDVWVEVNAPVIRPGQLVAIDLKLGNHGNNHRDFRLAGKLNPAWTSLVAHTPSGEVRDLRPLLRDQGFGAKEGYHQANFTVEQSGVYTVSQMLDRVMNHGKSIRGVRTAKTHIFVTPTVDSWKSGKPNLTDKPLGLPMELVLVTPGFAEVTTADQLSVRLLKNGRPQPDTTVSFIPRGHTLNSDFDPRYESKTDATGLARWKVIAPGVVLIVAHHPAMDERSETYEYTHYATTLTLHVGSPEPTQNN